MANKKTRWPNKCLAQFSFGQKIVKITTDNKNKITIDDSKISLLPAEVAQYSLSTYATEKVTIEAKKNAKYPSCPISSKISLLKYNEIPEWDSIGHMTLISGLEEGFGISIETDDIIDFSSVKKGEEILEKYNIKI